MKVLSVLLVLAVAACATPPPSRSTARVARPQVAAAPVAAPVTGQRTEYRGSGQLVHLTAMSDGSTRVEGSGGGTGCAGSYAGMGRFSSSTLTIRDENDPSCQVRLTRSDRKLTASGGRGMARGGFSGELTQR